MALEKPLQRASICCVLAAALLLAAGCGKSGPPAAAQVPDGPELAVLRVPWTFTIQDKDRHTIGTLTVRFTGEKARSCAGGNWKRVVVTGFESSGEPAFPGRDPLSYQLEGDRLTIGRNEICDAYRMLSGQLTENGLSGEYFSVGLEGRNQLGRVSGKPDP